MALMMRILVRYYLNEAASLASPGVDELRWLKPVRPGDVLSLRCTVVQARASRSKPDRGLVHTAIEILNQHQETVATLTMMNLLRRRPDPAPAVSGGKPGNFYRRYGQVLAAQAVTMPVRSGCTGSVNGAA